MCSINELGFMDFERVQVPCRGGKEASDVLCWHIEKAGTSPGCIGTGIGTVYIGTYGHIDTFAWQSLYTHALYYTLYTI